ncbi:MAG: hypothetical protein KUG81_08205 [Gammaproteobacteria bacterium]|nr:hypothetical protein [Gammaproteobacteria bacterium]
MSFDDGRKDQAKAIPIMEVANRLHIMRLKRAGAEWVGPCPVCGGTDRFGINPGLGLFSCRICSAGGDQIGLVEHVHKCDFKDALAFLVGAADAVIDPVKLAADKKKAAEAERERAKYAARAREYARKDARRIWRMAKPGAGTLAAEYLAGRGITFAAWPPTLRFIADHPYRKWIKGKEQIWHKGPCMIGAMQNANGQVCAVHQTWIDMAAPKGKALISGPNGEKGKAKLGRGSKKGNVIRLTPPSAKGILVMGEGIETTGTALFLNSVPGAAYWVGVDLGNMSGKQIGRNSGVPDMTDSAAWVPPEWVRHLIFIQDGDSAPKPTRAKLLAGLHRAMAVRPGLAGEIVHAGEGVDLNDLINDENEGGENE